MNTKKTRKKPPVKKAALKKAPQKVRGAKKQASKRPVQPRGNRTALAYAVSPTVLTRDSGEGALVVMDFRKAGEFFELSDQGKFVWQKIMDGWNETQVAEALAKSHKISVVDARSQLRTFVKKLESRGLLAIKQAEFKDQR
jgi:hypothetical protein